MATLWQTCGKMSEGVALGILATFLLPEGIDYPLEQFAVGYAITSRHFQGVYPVNKERDNLFTIPLKKLKVKIEIQEATSFKNPPRFIS